MANLTTLPTTSIFARTPNLVAVVVVAALCTASYLLAAWTHSPPLLTTTTTTTTTTFSSSSLPCNSSASSPSPPPFLSSNTTTLDFSVHHGASGADIDVRSAVVPIPSCHRKYAEHTPCEGQPRSLRFPRKKLEYRERHCPAARREKLRCLVPAPPGYRVPFRWPRSRDMAWFANAPHEELVAEKGVQNWIKKDGEVLRFPGGGTMFPRGADNYVEEIGRVVPLSGGAVRTAVDTGCGVASWGAYLMSRGVLTMSFAPKDTHEAQVQFALERGVPATLGILATKRLPYPSRAFDMAHCSRCLIPWSRYDGLYLIEIDRILRPGGYWILSGPPINWRRHFKGWKRTPEDLSSEQSSIESLARSLCWTKVQQKGDIAVWQKPINHFNCKTNRLCSGQDPDAAWYTKMEACITPLPEVSGPGDVAGGGIKNWPERLMAPPPRIAGGSTNGITLDMFYKDAELWRKRVAGYKAVSSQFSERGRYRNLLDMNAGFGGFAAALIDDPIWVMNVVPTAAEANILGVIYERGLIGTYQDWCEAMSTYPRTYDLLHADCLFTLYKGRCEMEDILLEMDRILRPEGTAIFRDDIDMIVKIKSIADRMRWDSRIIDHEDGPLQREKVLVAVKSFWTA